MYIEIRRTSAFHSFARTSSEASLTQFAYHCSPCVLMPRSWTGLPWALQSCRPQTSSRPLRATGVAPAGGVVGAVVGGVVGGVVGVVLPVQETPLRRQPVGLPGPVP